GFFGGKSGEVISYNFVSIATIVKVDVAPQGEDRMPIHIETRTGFIEIPPRLPEVHREIVDKLIDGDWCRFSTEDRKRAFYAIGCEAFLEYEKQEKEFDILQRPEILQG